MTDIHPVEIGFGDDVAYLATLPLYQTERVSDIFHHVLDFIHQALDEGLGLPYFAFDTDFGDKDWAALPKSLDVYVCGTDEGRALNLEARGKDYATNILSYPSHLPNELFKMMGQIPLGELVICHDVVARQSTEQGKNIADHLTHLVVHGVLHLLGFDHELGQAEQEEMESFEIAILAGLGIKNPYE